MVLRTLNYKLSTYIHTQIPTDTSTHARDPLSIDRQAGMQSYTLSPFPCFSLVSSPCFTPFDLILFDLITFHSMPFRPYLMLSFASSAFSCPSHPAPPNPFIPILPLSFRPFVYSRTDRRSLSLMHANLHHHPPPSPLFQNFPPSPLSPLLSTFPWSNLNLSYLIPN